MPRRGAWPGPACPDGARGVAAPIREMAAAGAGLPAPKLSRLTRPMLLLAGLFVPPAREMIEMAHEFEEPFLLDCSRIERVFGLQPTPIEEALATTTT